ncbi:HAD family hydrolase [Streptomyces roseifaciens]|uniref:HAD family hydrolase n=1 Tax=Streptomyces roseifaciens TaxID=1488406 RepID=UPI000AA0DE78|nr:HAD family hydrolase [Streptomyces roseifaciens]
MCTPASKVALFDLDGTLTDQRTAFARWAGEFSACHGIPLEDIHQADRELGEMRHEFFAALKESFALPASVEALHRQYRRRSAELVPYRPAVGAALDRLMAGGWRLGVVTNGAPAAQRLKLRTARLSSYFPQAVVVSGEYGVRKPDPALLHIALDALHAGDGPAVMVGDELETDVLAGMRAGLDTVWISSEPLAGTAVTGSSPTHTALSVVEAADWLLSTAYRPATRGRTRPGAPVPVGALRT